MSVQRCHEEIDQDALDRWLSPQATREHPAVRLGTLSLSFVQLDEEVRAIERMLDDLPPQAVVACSTSDRISVLGTLLACLRTRRVWMPVDLNQPQARLKTMLDIRPDIVLGSTQELSSPLFADMAAKRITTGLVRINGTRATLSGRTRCGGFLSDRWAEQPLLGPSSDAAYISFTSGSTGQPKPIVGSRSSLISFIEWELGRLGVEEGWRFSQLTAPTFDAYLREVLVPLATRGTICIPGKTPLLGDDLATWIRAEHIDVLHCVPTVLRTLSDQASSLSSLRWIATAGAALYGSDVERWLPRMTAGTRMLNFYGASETTMIKLCYELSCADRGVEIVPIGSPIDGAAAVVVDDEMVPCLQGTVGEIVVRTPDHSLGYYFSDPAGSSFFRNPHRPESNEWFYRTGDLGIELANGDFGFVGRRDREVKVRGVRLHLAGLESVAKSVPEVQDVAVLTVADSDKELELVAFVVGDIEPRELRLALGDALPTEALPRTIVAVNDRLPTNNHGKVDQQALLDMLEDNVETVIDLTKAETATEATLVQVWRTVLGREAIGVNADFFDVGGNSLLALRLTSAMKQALSRHVPLSAVFDHPTIRSLAGQLDGSADLGHTGAIPLTEIDGSRPSVFVVHPAGGMVLPYRELAQAIGERANVFGLQAAGLAEGEVADRSIEQMARRYLAEVRRCDTGQPIMLTGWSAGGLVAYEMARQLRIEDPLMTVSVVLLDSCAPGRYDEPNEDASILADLLSTLGTSECVWRKRFSALPRDKMIERALEAAQHLPGWSQVSVSDAGRYLDVFKLHVGARQEYIAAPLGGPLTIIQPTGYPARADRASMSVWESLADVDVVQVAGNHMTLVDQPYVAEVADALIAEFAQVLAVSS